MIMEIAPGLGGKKEARDMAVEKVDEKYRCNVCGNEVVVTVVGGGTLVCCGEDMEKIEYPENQPGSLPPDG